MILWLGILSFMVTLLIFLYNGQAYHICYGPEVTTLSFSLPYVTPVMSCMGVIFLISFVLIFFGPLLTTFMIAAIYTIIFNQSFTFYKYVLWFSWLIFVYYVIFQFRFVPFL